MLILQIDTLKEKTLLFSQEKQQQQDQNLEGSLKN